ncbi:MAG: glycerophosphodiester phosphodiesterase [Candidatus Lokiarchaeota archaeon]|nr:glycerophosphodiester phosphodiesterase [Candidatus Lokiarchaeota archaeon]
MSKKIELVAHRGASDQVPENTLRAFEKAIELGADYIEFDVRKTKDNELIIIHDPLTLRTTKYLGFVNKMTLEKIKTLKIKINQEIPTLRELIELSGNKIRLLCEVKVRGIAKLLLKILEEMSVTKSTLIISFKHDVLHRIQKLNNDIQVGYLEPRGLGWLFEPLFTKQIIKKAKLHKINLINIQKWYLKKSMVERAHQNGIRVFTWTINSERQLKQALNKGVDGVLTNNINKIQALLKNYRS